ncbi:iron uptake system component EfeO [Leifsonia sp. AK011]|uniref:iron uptake system protein EfeO n=1 Tax=Leifsonia sp. AK011 TaxID=2723075 RepID=UPI0015C752AD|nr:iron uptake system protein EfeO [Leifsonia sp. AK011]NYF10165.1 iron uptake system component EfeO [Leifsonia sp. AK011]
MTIKTLATGVAAFATLALLAGCVPNATGGSVVVAVESTADSCTVDNDTVASGTVTFRVTNAGDRVTEFYLLGEDELSIVSEVENIAPGSSRDLTVVAQPGSYFTVCKPGMIGDGIGQSPFTVTGDAIAIDADSEAARADAVARYTAYVKTQAAELVPAVQEFVDAYIAGEDDTARGLFPLVRVSYERIEPTASQFGDLDPAIDYRKPGAEAEGLEFTGFHRIEMDLWLDAARANYPDETIDALDTAGREAVGAKLVEDVTALYDEVHSDDFALSVSDITNGAIGLLDEVAAPDGKLPGEENEFAHTDLYDFYANVEGAEVAYLAVRDIALASGADGEALVAELDEEFAAMKALLLTYGNYDDGFVFYDTVTQEERNELGAQLNALSEPLAKLTYAVLGVEQSE